MGIPILKEGIKFTRIDLSDADCDFIENFNRTRRGEMPETTFENAKVGDNVWSIIHGWGKIVEICCDQFPNSRAKRFPIAVQFSHSRETFNTEGKQYDGCYQCLFWDEVKITPPERPKRKVKKVAEGWINIIKSNHPGADALTDNAAVYLDKGWAGRVRSSKVEYLGDPLFIHHEYEIEE